MVTSRASVGYVDGPQPTTSAPGVTRVTMLARISGTRNGAEWPRPGEEIELPAAEAADLIRNYLAKPAPMPVERAVVEETIERAIVDQPAERAAVQEPSEQAVVSRAQSARPSRIGRSKGK